MSINCYYFSFICQHFVHLRAVLIRFNSHNSPNVNFMLRAFVLMGFNILCFFLFISGDALANFFNFVHTRFVCGLLSLFSSNPHIAVSSAYFSIYNLFLILLTIAKHIIAFRHFYMRQMPAKLSVIWVLCEFNLRNYSELSICIVQSLSLGYKAQRESLNSRCVYSNRKRKFKRNAAVLKWVTNRESNECSWRFVFFLFIAL